MIMRFLLIFFLSTLFLCASNRITVTISDLDLEIGANLDLATLSEGYGEDMYLVGGGILTSEEGDGVSIVYGSLMVESPVVGFEAIVLQLGLKPVSVNDGSSRRFFAVPFGANMEYELGTGESKMPLTAIASIFYAPTRLTYLDGDGYYEYRVGVAMEADKAQGFIQYRSIYTIFPDETLNVNRTIFVGATVHF